MRLVGKVIIVTGSTTGIGKAIAMRCAAEGANVVVHGLESELGSAVCHEIGADRSVLHIQDLKDQDAPAALVSRALQEFGKLDAIVNNAAWVTSSNIDDTTPELLNEVFEVNTFAPLALIRSALPALQKTQGSVLNIGSVNAWSGEPNLLAYSMSKGALVTMTRNLGDVLFRNYNIRVNQINPGWVLTEKEIQRKKDQGLNDDWYKDLPAVHAPAGRLLDPKEIAAASVYWLSDEAGPVSGQVVDLEQYPFIGRNLPKN